MWTRLTAVKDDVRIVDALFCVFPVPIHDKEIQDKLIKCRLKQVFAREKMQCLKETN